MIEYFLKKPWNTHFPSCDLLFSPNLHVMEIVLFAHCMALRCQALKNIK